MHKMPQTPKHWKITNTNNTHTQTTARKQIHMHMHVQMFHITEYASYRHLSSRPMLWSLRITFTMSVLKKSWHICPGAGN